MAKKRNWNRHPAFDGVSSSFGYNIINLMKTNKEDKEAQNAIIRGVFDGVVGSLSSHFEKDKARLNIVLEELNKGLFTIEDKIIIIDKDVKVDLGAKEEEKTGDSDEVRALKKRILQLEKKLREKDK